MPTWQDSIEHVLHAHSRAITDINFSAHHPDVLATCAVDSFVHCWDLRVPARPVISFSDWFAGATQVKWNRQDSHVIASSHDRYLRIWDDRKGAYPLRSIEAHATKIYGVDWNRIRPNAIVTCSLDKTVKFWNYEKLEDVPERTIQTPFPVWRARHTPFGWGLLAMPQRGNSDLHLYDRRTTEGTEPGGNVAPVHSFPGHKGQVKEFLWRPRGTIVDGVDHREFQLVSWGTDRELRLHRVISQVMEDVGYNRGQSFIPTLNLTRKDAKYKTFRDEPPEEIYNEVFESQPGTSPGPGQSFHARSRGSLSVGMSKVSIPHARGWIQGGGLGSRIGMHGKTTVRQDTNPIAWMRGVKIASWDVETLGDEITHVGDKFTKVIFEAVDVQQRKATISMHGPWGPESNSLFLKVDIKFPVEYPGAAIPEFNIQKTASVTNKLAADICAELRTLAETYVSRKRGCLEAVLRFLLGEQSLEESIAWILGETDDANKNPVDGELAGDVSSDEDDGGVGDFQGQDLGLSSSELLQTNNANINVPVAKACGALWADNGRLVCFFPPKKDKAASFLDSLHLKEMDRSSRNDKIFEGFGRLQTSSPGPKNAVGTVSTTDDAASEYSDDSFASSSSSSGSSDLLTSLPSRFQPPNAWRGGSIGLRRSRSTDRSQRSATGLRNFKTSSDLPQNIVSIHNLEDLLPAKRELATEYRIFGNGPDVCAHNAEVAARLGNRDLSQVWGLIKLILHNEVPLESLPRSNRESNVVVLARRALSNLKRKDSGIDLSFDKESTVKISKTGRIRWGENPMGGRWLVPTLFEYFERLADVQMLAMLSCIFNEPKSTEDSWLLAQRQEHNQPMQLKSPAFSIDYYPSPAVAQSLLLSASLFISASKAIQTPLSVQLSAGSSADVWNSDSTTPFSTGTTPPSTTRPNRMSEDRESRGSQSISVSTEQRFTRRSNSNVASTFASSLSRGFALASVSSSPPSNSNKKGPSPSESFTSAPQTAGAGANSGWSATTMFGGKPAAIPEHLTLSASTTAISQSFSDESESGETPVPAKAPKMKIKVSLKNQNVFDNDGYASIPLLDPRQEWRYKAYRAAYAHLLFIWGLPLERCEVLKFDGLESYFVSRLGGGSSLPGAGKSLISIGQKSTRKVSSKPVDRGLAVRRHCVRCGNSSFSSSADQRDGKRTAVLCSKCQKSPSKIPCSVCGEAVQGLYVPCLNCGHVTHFSCHRQWFSHNPGEDKVENGKHQLCASGCGCICSEHEIVEGPTPPGPARAASNQDDKTIKPGKTEAAGEDGDGVWDGRPDEDPWEHSAFASLARGLGGGLSRGLAPKGSNATIRRSGSGLGTGD